MFSEADDVKDCSVGGLEFFQCKPVNLKKYFKTKIQLSIITKGHCRYLL